MQGTFLAVRPHPATEEKGGMSLGEPEPLPSELESSRGRIVIRLGSLMAPSVLNPAAQRGKAIRWLRRWRRIRLRLRQRCPLLRLAEADSEPHIIDDVADIPRQPLKAIEAVADLTVEDRRRETSEPPAQGFELDFGRGGLRRLRRFESCQRPLEEGRLEARESSFAWRSSRLRWSWR